MTAVVLFVCLFVSLIAFALLIQIKMILVEGMDLK